MSTPITPTEAQLKLAELLLTAFAPGSVVEAARLIAESEAKVTEQLRSELAYAKASETLYHDEGTALTVERDQLRAERDRLRDEKWEGIHALEQRAERAEAEVERLRDGWKTATGEARAHFSQSCENLARAERAEAELAQEKAASARPAPEPQSQSARSSLAAGSAGFCMNCEHWDKRDAMQELGYVPSAAIGYCPLFNKFTEATHGIHCTAYSPND